MKRTRVKICGITSPQAALQAAAAGADAIGLVFYPRSPRAVNLAQAAAICEQLPPFVDVVALTVDADRQLIEDILATLPVTLLQFHGDESAAYCEQFQHPYIKALRMRDDVDISRHIEQYRSARGLLLDSYRPGVPGGTGEQFDWHRVPAEIAGQIILAGGLRADNVAAAIQQLGPWAVDVSGGVESAPGVKDPSKMLQFMQQVYRSDWLENSGEQ